MKFQLMKYLSPLAVIVSLLMLTGCATGPTVRVDFDRLADFTHYQSFGFVSPLGTDRGGYQSIVSQHLKAATQRQLEARGLHLDTVKPQLLINFYAQLNEKLRITTMPEARMGLGYYGYRAGLYAPWPMYYDQTIVTPYIEGTLNIDVVDAVRKQLVWESVVIESVTQETLDNLATAINAAVTAAFAKYPIPGPGKTR